LLFNLFYRKYGGLTSLLAKIIPIRVLGRLAARLSYNLGSPQNPKELGAENPPGQEYKGAYQLPII
jgi:hypothetical protein